MSAEILPFDKRPDQPPPSFVMTPTATDIIRLIEYTRDHGDIGLVIGDPGLGKTTTLLHFADSNRDAAYVMLGAARAGLTPALKTVAEEVKAYAERQSSHELFEAICTSLTRYHDAYKVLLIDEAQAATDITLESLRALVDVTGVALVLVGNRYFPRRLFGKRGLVRFAQLTSRVGMKLDLTAPDPGDVKAVLSHWAITDERSFDLIEQHIVLAGGGLRSARKLVDLAQEFAGPEIAIEYRHLKQAAKALKQPAASRGGAS